MDGSCIFIFRVVWVRLQKPGMQLREVNAFDSFIQQIHSIEHKLCARGSSGAGDRVVEKVTEKLERSKHTDIDERQIYSI